MGIAESRMENEERRMEKAERRKQNAESLLQEEHFSRQYFRDTGLVIQRARFEPVEIDSACKRAGIESGFVQSRVEFS